MDGEGVGKGFVEGALPPFPVGVGLPSKSLGGEGGGGEVEDADLLARKGREGLDALAGDEGAVVGVHDGLDVELSLVERQEGDVAQGVVFAFAGAAQVGDGLEALLDGEACRFGEVVIFLLVDDVDEVGELFLERWQQGVSVAHDGIGGDVV